MHKFTTFKLATLTATSYLAAASCLALLANTASAQGTPTLTIKNFIGTIDVRTGDYDKITITNADGANVERLNNGILIDDDQTIRNTNCRKSKTSIKLSVGGKRWYKRKGGYKNLNEYPQLKITAPESTHLVIDNAVIFGHVGHIGSADINVRSCGDLELGNINGHLDVSIAGSGDFTAQNIQSTEISVAGSGDVNIGNVAGSVSVASAGSGDNDIGNVGGDFDYTSAGSGDLDVGNILGDTEITTAGSSDVEIDRIEGNLKYTSGGSGDFEADYVGGKKLSSKSGGSGSVEIEDGNVTDLYIKIGGSGSAFYDGQSTNADLYASGSGEITVREPSGRLVKEKRGSGSIRIK